MYRKRTAVEISHKLREQRYYIGATSGSFDLFHPGFRYPVSTSKYLLTNYSVFR